MCQSEAGTGVALEHSERRQASAHPPDLHAVAARPHEARDLKETEMPLTLTLTEGTIPRDKVREAVVRLSEAMLDSHELRGNKVMTPNVTANVQIVPEGQSYSGGEEFKGAWVEWKVPSFAFATSKIQKSYGKQATDIIHELSGGTQPRENVYFNVVHTVDGAWNLDGGAMSNDEILAAISKG
jgi:hypothetical protein